MPRARSKPTAKEPISVERPAGKVTSLDIHRALFPDGPPKMRTLAELKEGIGRLIAERYARNRR